MLYKTYIFLILIKVDVHLMSQADFILVSLASYVVPGSIYS
jgi:hypothetical protein